MRRKNDDFKAPNADVRLITTPQKIKASLFQHSPPAEFGGNSLRREEGPNSAMQLLTLFASSLLLNLAATHGIVTSPPVREPGAASLNACGPAITDIIKADNQTGTEVLHKVSSTDAKFQPSKCNIALCKGLQLEDNLDNVQRYQPGQVVDFTVWTKIPHKGWASVAIVDAATPYPNLLVGKPLLSFETSSVSGYSHEMSEEEGMQLAPVDMEFNVTIPTDLGNKCAKAGECVLQWTWFGRVVKQTYESCIDFVVDDEKFAEDPAIVGGQKILS